MRVSSETSFAASWVGRTSSEALSGLKRTDSCGKRADAEELTTRNATTSARCFLLNYFPGFLGLWRATASSILPLRLQLSKVFRTALCDLPPASPPKTNGSGILLLCQNGAMSLPRNYARSTNNQPSHPIPVLHSGRSQIGVRKLAGAR